MITDFVLHFVQEVKNKKKCILFFILRKIENIEDLCEKCSTLLHFGKENRKTAARTLSF